MENKWVIYEIPGHKVGMCAAKNFPRRPQKQVNTLLKRVSGTRNTLEHITILQKLSEITHIEALEAETEWQDKLGYKADIDLNIGRVFSEETKTKMSENHANVTGSNNPMYGVPSPSTGVPSSRRKAVVFRGNTYDSIRDASKYGKAGFITVKKEGVFI